MVPREVRLRWDKQPERHRSDLADLCRGGAIAVVEGQALGALADPATIDLLACASEKAIGPVHYFGVAAIFLELLEQGMYLPLTDVESRRCLFGGRFQNRADAVSNTVKESFDTRSVVGVVQSERLAVERVFQIALRPHHQIGEDVR